MPWQRSRGVQQPLMQQPLRPKCRRHRSRCLQTSPWRNFRSFSDPQATGDFKQPEAGSGTTCLWGVALFLAGPGGEAPNETEQTNTPNSEPPPHLPLEEGGGIAGQQSTVQVCPSRVVFCLHTAVGSSSTRPTEGEAVSGTGRPAVPAANLSVLVHILQVKMTWGSKLSLGCLALSPLGKRLEVYMPAARRRRSLASI